jgi:hypothetical protein
MASATATVTPNSEVASRRRSLDVRHLGAAIWTSIANVYPTQTWSKRRVDPLPSQAAVVVNRPGIDGNARPPEVAVPTSVPAPMPTPSGGGRWGKRGRAEGANRRKRDHGLSEHVISPCDRHLDAICICTLVGRAGSRVQTKANALCMHGMNPLMRLVISAERRVALAIHSGRYPGMRLLSSASAAISPLLRPLLARRLHESGISDK